MEKRVQDYGKEILNVVRSNVSPAVLAKRLQDFHENDLADVLQELSVVERCKLYRVLDMDTLSDIFEYWRCAGYFLVGLLFSDGSCVLSLAGVCPFDFKNVSSERI